MLGFPPSPALPRQPTLATDRSATGLDRVPLLQHQHHRTAAPSSLLYLSYGALPKLFPFRHYQQTKLHKSFVV